MLKAFTAPGRFYKGNIHLHSTASDGTQTPAEVISAYRDRGYDFVSLTDHFLPERYFRPDSDRFITVTDTRDLGCEDFTTILGAELHGPALETGDLWHIVAVGLPLDFAPLGENETGLEIVQRAAAAGAFLGVAHPAWYSLTTAETMPMLPYVHAIEVLNYACTPIGRQDGWYFADELYARGHTPTAYAADDAHRIAGDGPIRDAFGGWVKVKSESNSPEALLTAFKAGNYYASTGPEIEDISWDGETLRIQSSPAVAYLVSGDGARYRHVFGEDMTSAEFSRLDANGEIAPWLERSYFRVTVFAADGTRAWSQPFFLQEFAD